MSNKNNFKSQTRDYCPIVEEDETNRFKIKSNFNFPQDDSLAIYSLHYEENNNDLSFPNHNQIIKSKEEKITSSKIYNYNEEFSNAKKLFEKFEKLKKYKKKILKKNINWDNFPEDFKSKFLDSKDLLYFMSKIRIFSIQMLKSKCLMKLKLKDIFKNPNKFEDNDIIKNLILISNYCECHLKKNHCTGMLIIIKQSPLLTINHRLIFTKKFHKNAVIINNLDYLNLRHRGFWENWVSKYLKESNKKFRFYGVSSNKIQLPNDENINFNSVFKYSKSCNDFIFANQDIEESEINQEYSDQFLEEEYSVKVEDNAEIFINEDEDYEYACEEEEKEEYLENKNFLKRKTKREIKKAKPPIENEKIKGNLKKKKLKIKKKIQLCKKTNLESPSNKENLIHDFFRKIKETHLQDNDPKIKDIYKSYEKIYKIENQENSFNDSIIKYEYPKENKIIEKMNEISINISKPLQPCKLSQINSNCEIKIILTNNLKN